ncbi:MAG: hypothetical protein HRU15_17170 [Planctomycetes bacterium]|nr:hypothetical protein [Planctomycetota bacterium]
MSDNIHIQKIFEHMRILMLMENSSSSDLIHQAYQELQLPNRICTYHNPQYAMKHLESIQLKEDAPDIMLLDLSITVIEPMLIVSEVLDNPITNHVQIYVLGQPEIDEDIIEAYDCGIRGYIARPRNNDEALHALRVLKDFWQCALRPDLDQLLVDGVD